MDEGNADAWMKTMRGAIGEMDKRVAQTHALLQNYSLQSDGAFLRTLNSVRAAACTCSIL
jgi:hypothetical protein